MLCAAGALFTGSNPTRVFSFFKHIGMSYISLRTYYYLQKLYLIPAVNCIWTSEQQSLLTSFQGKHIDVGGDARCDSPGHCAKYGTYHMVELESNKVLTVELVQVYNVVTISSMSQAVSQQQLIELLLCENTARRMSLLLIPVEKNTYAWIVYPTIKNKYN